MSDVTTALYDAIDWQKIHETVDDMLDEGASRREIDAAVEKLIDEAARAVGSAIDFRAILRGPLAALGEALERVDVLLIRGALRVIYELARPKRARIARRLGRIEALMTDRELRPKRRSNLMRRAAKLKRRLAEATAAEMDPLDSVDS